MRKRIIAKNIRGEMPVSFHIFVLSPRSGILGQKTTDVFSVLPTFGGTGVIRKGMKLRYSDMLAGVYHEVESDENGCFIDIPIIGGVSRQHFFANVLLKDIELCYKFEIIDWGLRKAEIERVNEIGEDRCFSGKV